MSQLKSATLAVALTLTITHSIQAQRRVDMNFNGQLTSAIGELRSKLKADPLINGQKLRLGKFTGPNLPDSNFEIAFELAFKNLASNMLSDESQLIVRGVYDYVAGEADENADLDIIQFVIEVVQRRKVIQRVTREINNTSDITRMTGVDVAPPDTTDTVKRLKKVADAFDKPGFKLRNGTQVTTVDNSDFAVEIRKRIGGKGSLIAVTPANKAGRAFVDLGLSDTFEIVLYNHQGRCDAVAKIAIDGLDVANTFSEDKRKYTGYTVRRTSGGNVTPHAVPGWLRTAANVENNVFRFVINQLGQGAATAMKSRSSRGVINVQFFEAVPPNEELPGRSFGEVGKGEPITKRYQVQEMKLRETPIVNLTIRYSNVPE